MKYLTFQSLSLAFTTEKNKLNIVSSKKGDLKPNLLMGSWVWPTYVAKTMKERKKALATRSDVKPRSSELDTKGILKALPSISKTHVSSS